MASHPTTRSSRRLTSGVAGLIIAMVAIPAAAAGPRRAPSRIADSARTTRVESRVVLSPVSSLDFQTEFAVRTSNKSTDDAHVQGRGLVVTRSDPAQGRFALPSVQREVNSLWRLELASTDDIQDLQVEYDVVAPDGTEGRFSHVDNPGSQIAVRAMPLPPRVVERNHHGVVVEGGALLDLDLMPASEAGAYQGTIRVNITHL